jgi:outer membrane protein assembly factor BamB
MSSTHRLRIIIITLLGLVLIPMTPAGTLGDELSEDSEEVLEPIPQFRSSTNGLGMIVGPPIRNNETVWTYETESSVISSPVVFDSRLYVGTMGGKVLCLSAYIGTLVWETDIGDGVESSPAYYEGRIFVGADDGKLYCLNATDGTQVWNTTTGSAIKSSPTVVNGQVFVGSNDFKMYSFDVTDGRELWNYSTAGWVYSSPAVVDGSVFFGSCDGNVHCVNATDGSLEWIFEAEYIPASPAVTSKHVIVGAYDDTLYYLDRETGEEVMNVTGMGSGIYSSPVVIEYYLDGYEEFPVVVVADNEGTMFVIDGRGEVRRRMEHATGITSSPIVTAEPDIFHSFVAYGTDDGYLHGRMYESPYYGLTDIPVFFAWKVKVGSSVQSSPFIWHRKIFVGSATEDGGGRVTCIGALDSEIDEWFAFIRPVHPVEGEVSVGVMVRGFIPDQMEAELDGVTKVMEDYGSIGGNPAWSTTFEARPPEGKRNVTVRAIIDGKVVLEESSEYLVLVEGWDTVDVEITRPSSGTGVKGVFTVSGTVESNYTEGRGLIAWWDNDLDRFFQKENVTDTWSLPVDTAGLSDGDHVLHVVVSDTYRRGEDKIRLTVGEDGTSVVSMTEIGLVVLLIIAFVILLVTKPPRVPEGASAKGEPPGKL